MKIYVIGSTALMHDMVQARDDLVAAKLDGWIHEHYDLLVQGKMPAQHDLYESGERAKIKIENDYLKVHYKHILQSDAVLIVNAPKNGVNNYIGGNVLIEMGQAYVNDKKIFFLYGLPDESPYLDEILAMSPICLNGDVENIKQHI